MGINSFSCFVVCDEIYTVVYGFKNCSLHIRQPNTMSSKRPSTVKDHRLLIKNAQKSKKN